VTENATILYRGARYELGQGPGFFGIWPAGVPQAQPFEWWPATPEGWHGAWSRFTGIEAPSAIVQLPAAVPGGQGAPPGPVTASAPAAALTEGSGLRGIVGAALLALGVLLGITAMFPHYLGSASLASSAPEAWPHAIYLAVWAASAVLIASGGGRRRIGTMLAAGATVVTLGFYLTDVGTAIAGGASLIGAGFVLGLIGLAACAAGCVVAYERQADGQPGPRRGQAMAPVVTIMFAILAAVGVAIAFAPSWDRFTLSTATGLSQTLTEGNAFDNPGWIIAGNVVVMVLLVVVTLVAAGWRPVRLGGVLLIGAAVPMVAQAISAAVQMAEPVAPAQFGISSAQASAAGLTISSGLTASFWLYCAFLVVLMATCAWMMGLRRLARPARPAPQAPVTPVMSGSETA
jgi:hypothetical protein